MNKNSHESIIISTDQKYALVSAIILILILTALKGFIMGYWIASHGKRCS